MVAGRIIRIGVGLAPHRGSPIGAAGSLFDNFDDNSQDTTKWNVAAWRTSGVVSGGTTSETNQRLELTASTIADRGAGYVSAQFYDLTGSCAYAKPTLATAIDANQEFFLALGPDTSHYYRAVYFNGTLYFQSVVNAVFTTIGSAAYSSTTHAWWRIRHVVAGDTLYCDTAPSSASNPPVSGDWTNLSSAARDSNISVNNVQAALELMTTATTAAPATVYFDGFNTAISAASNELSGTSSLTFSPSATATGLGTLSGSSALAFADSGTLTGLGTLAGSSSLTFSPSGTVTGLGSVTGTTALTFAPSGTTTGLGGITGSSTLAFSPSGTVTGLGSLIGASAITFTPAGTINGIGTLAGTAALTLAGSGTATGIGTLAGASSLALASSGTLTGLGSLMASTSLSFGLSGTLGTAGSNDLTGTAALTFTGSGALFGLGQLSGSTTFSLTISGQLVAGAGFVPTPLPGPANLTTSVLPSETNVIGPARPGKVTVTTASAASGSFVPAVKPARVKWRT